MGYKIHFSLDIIGKKQYLCKRNWIMEMMDKHIYLLIFATSLTFIVTHLYGWLLKWFYRPNAYREHFHELFPAQRSVGVIYLLQLCELPYLLRIGNPDALLYVNAFALLFFSLQMLVMCELYFFPRNKHPLKDYWIVLPIAAVLLPLFLQATGLISLPEGWRQWAFVGVTLVFLPYFAWNIRMAVRIGRSIRQVNENTYADSDDFPERFARYIQWVPTLLLVLLMLNFYADNVWVKFVRDWLFIGANIWFCIMTLNPWRKAFNEREREIIDQMERPAAGMKHLSEQRYQELNRRLEHLLEDEHIFTEPHITIDTLMQHLGTNSKYIAEVIRRSGYQSFYDMICQHRVRYAISLIHQHPEERLGNIADRCGFSSPSSMNKAFKAQGKELPSSYKI